MHRVSASATRKPSFPFPNCGLEDNQCHEIKYGEAKEAVYAANMGQFTVRILIALENATKKLAQYRELNYLFSVHAATSCFCYFWAMVAVHLKQPSDARRFSNGF